VTSIRKVRRTDGKKKLDRPRAVVEVRRIEGPYISGSREKKRIKRSRTSERPEGKVRTQSIPKT